ncbi:MAG: hypothetical protein JST92_15235, partial [Deltaproteobacteria bacterium]|nr:hypothetical protein [Deltaproteobacteria bacterium]
EGTTVEGDTEVGPDAHASSPGQPAPAKPASGGNKSSLVGDDAGGDGDSPTSGGSTGGGSSGAADEGGGVTTQSVTLPLAYQFVVTLDEGETTLAAQEGARFKWAGDQLIIQINGKKQPMDHADGALVWTAPSLGATTADVDAFERTVQPDTQADLSITSEPSVTQFQVTNIVGLTPGVTRVVKLATRARLSIWAFNTSFIDPSKSDESPKDHSKATVGLNDAALAKLHEANVDDFSLVRTWQFKPGHPDELDWGVNYRPLNTEFEGYRSDYLRKLVPALHAIDVQVMAGYEIVEKGKLSGDLGKAFNAWLAKASDDEIGAHAQAIADKLDEFDLDGINFDFEVNGLGIDPAHKQALENLYRETAVRIAPKGRVVSFDCAPDITDGDNTNSFMQVQPLSLANVASNVIARPMCFDDTNFTGFDKVKASVACALRATNDNKGSGLHPSKIQYGIWTSKAFTDDKTTEKWFDLFRQNRVGVVLYNMDDQPDMLGHAKRWNDLLNRSQSLPGVQGQPLQWPLKKVQS